MNNNFFDQLFSMTTLLSDKELETLALKCKDLIKDRERIEREELRQELMKNLQKALSDILHSGFVLEIKNMELNPEEDDCYAVCFSPEDIYSIEMIDTK